MKVKVRVPTVLEFELEVERWQSISQLAYLKIDAFREAVQASSHYGMCLTVERNKSIKVRDITGKFVPEH